MTLRIILIASLAPARAGFPPASCDDPGIAVRPGAQARIAALRPRLSAADARIAAASPRSALTAEATGLSFQTEDALRDCDFGRWAGQSPEDLMMHEPDSLATWVTDPAAAPHGGESLADLHRRAGAWLDGQDRNATGTLAVIADALLIAALISHALGQPAGFMRRLNIRPLSRTRLSKSGELWRLSAGE